MHYYQSYEVQCLIKPKFYFKIYFKKWCKYLLNFTCLRPISKNFTVTSRNAMIWVINHVDIFLDIFDPFPPFVDHFTKWGLCSNIYIWLTHSIFHVHMVYGCPLMKTCEVVNCVFGHFWPPPPFLDHKNAWYIKTNLCQKCLTFSWFLPILVLKK